MGEAALGGDLWRIFNVHPELRGNSDVVRYYAASVSMALRHMHERAIIYRDLKPENIMLTDEGLCKLTDLGLSKFVIGMTNTICGTAEYLAPEVVSRKYYNEAVDWWQIGILVWELMVGRAPFCARTFAQAAKALGSNAMMRELSSPEFDWPAQITEPCRAFLIGMLHFTPHMRLPMRPEGDDLLEECPWFDDFSWGGFQVGLVEPPFVPSCAPPETGGGPPKLPKPKAYVDDGTGWDTAFGCIR
eukprot:NODE_3142_length_824_cov_313.612484.p1 GENE.NODE_3142_length_824_cov_313.612484~~NODE_3142_length_824_cov_313.612484.p1  ORF type:complete len:245 (-),score=65.60 NODE_3142_length_824_cov_313.612484:72-806(-)